MVDSLNIMEQIDKQGLGSSLPILQRLDRAEGLVQFLERKKSMSGTGSQSTVEMALHEDKWKTLSSALEEVHYKGTLLERLEMLEKRVLQLQLSMEMEMVNKLTSSFSSFVPSDKLEHSTTSCKSDDDSVKVQDNAIKVNCERNSQVNAKRKMHKSRVTCIRPKKWLGLLSLRACGK